MIRTTPSPNSSRDEIEVLLPYINILYGSNWRRRSLWTVHGVPPPPEFGGDNINGIWWVMGWMGWGGGCRETEFYRRNPIVLAAYRSVNRVPNNNNNGQYRYGVRFFPLKTVCCYANDPLHIQPIKPHPPPPPARRTVFRSFSARPSETYRCGAYPTPPRPTSSLNDPFVLVE